MTDDTITATGQTAQSGLNKFLGRETRTSLINTCVDEFLRYCDLQPTKPTPAEVERKLTTQLNDEIIHHNKETNEKWSYITSLPPNVIARVMNHLENIALISFTGESTMMDEDASLLAIYQSDDGPDKGTWSTSQNALMRKIHEYSSLLSPKSVDEVIKYLHAHAPQRSLTKDPDLCPVANGIYNRRTKTLEEFSPEYVYMYKLQTAYNPHAQNVLIQMPDGVMWDCESQLDSFSDDEEMRILLREILTAAVYPNHRWDKAILPYSTKGNNGKGTYAALIRNMLGENAWCSISLREFGMDFMCAPLIACNAVITDENDVGAYIDSAANFKSCTTHDALTINRKYKSPVKIKWSGFIMECINELPRFHDRSESMLRRFLIMPFEKSFKGVERKYIKNEYLEMQAVREYYLRIALESDIYELSCPQICKDALKQYRTYNDPLRDFFESQVEMYTAWKYYPLNFVYEHYKAWYTQTHPGGTVLPFPKFRLDLAAMAIDSGNWTCAGPDKVVHIPADGMVGTEKAIIDFNLEQYMNKSYHGSDPDKLTNFQRPKAARGVLVRVDNNHPDPEKDDILDTIETKKIETSVENISDTTSVQNLEYQEEIEHDGFSTAQKKEVLTDIHISDVLQNEDLNTIDVEDVEPGYVVPPNPMGHAPQTGETYRQRVSSGSLYSEQDTPLPSDDSFDSYESYGFDI